jgi:hypothetical protein
MNTQPVVMVQVSDAAWTRDALHRACTFARQQNASIVLVQMIAVNQLAFIGTEFGMLYQTTEEKIAFAEYQATIEDYGIPFRAVTFQYFSLGDAIVEAAQNAEASWVFAHLPHSVIPLWDRVQAWSLRRGLASINAQWMEKDSMDSVMIEDVHALASFV